MSQLNYYRLGLSVYNPLNLSYSHNILIILPLLHSLVLISISYIYHGFTAFQNIRSVSLNISGIKDLLFKLREVIVEFF